MVHGYFPAGTNLPYIEVSIFSGKKILHAECILDTGFSGCLKLDKETADKLGIITVEEAHLITANGEKVHADLARAYVEMEGRKRLAEILIVPGVRLAGVDLFSIFGYKAVVDCRNRTAHLERTN